MQAPKHTPQSYAHRLFRLADPVQAHPFRPRPVIDQPSEARGLNSGVRFFVDYSISVAVNSVARHQALRAKLNLSTPGGFIWKVVIGTTCESEQEKFVAYSDATSLFLKPSNGLFVTNDTPRELEHSIYLYLSEKLCGQDLVEAEVIRETNSMYGLPVLVGSSDEGPRSLHVKGVA
jgi:hypothetical protein